MMAADRQVRHDRLWLAARRHVAIAVRKAQHGIGIADIDPLRVGPRRIKRDAKRISEPGCEDRGLWRAAAVLVQHADTAALALGDEDVAVRRSADNARARQAGSKKVDFKAVWDDWLLVGPVHCSDDIPHGF